MKLSDIEKANKYDLLLKQIDGLIDNDVPLITNLSNISAAIKQTFNDISWVGFYIAIEDMLYLGPFQGKVACTKIKFGEGVCGNAAEKCSPQVVPDVHKYPGHIACDAESNSEIVIPLLRDGKTYLVLDLDSKLFGYFNDIDIEYLQSICDLMKNKLVLKRMENC